MITIGKPYIREEPDKAILAARIIDENRNLDTEMWYSVNPKYGAALCKDACDAFLIALLPLAIRLREDIYCEADISRKLHFHLNNTIIPLFARFWKDCSPIKISASSLHDLMDSHVCVWGGGVATGCSLGVDSLSAIYHHMSLPDESGYKLTHLTFFNCGQLGDYDLDGVKKYFAESVQDVEQFCSDVKMPLIVVNSNVNEFYRDSGVTVLMSVGCRSAGCVLALQKMISRYCYASSFCADRVQFSDYDSAHFESVFLPLFSTENCEFVLADPMMTRVEKTNRVAGEKLTAKHLKVCWAEQTAYEAWNNRSFLEGKTKKNCGWCGKCLRTLLTLEVLGKDLTDYSANFELTKYYEHRNAFICEVLTGRDNVFYREISDLMCERRFVLPPEAEDLLKRNACINKMRNFARRVLRRIGV